MLEFVDKRSQIRVLTKCAEPKSDAWNRAGYLVAFLASEKASYVNGTMLTIDGGLIRSVF